MRTLKVGQEAIDVGAAHAINAHLKFKLETRLAKIAMM